MTGNERPSYYAGVMLVEPRSFLRARHAGVLADVQCLQYLRFLGNAERG